MESKNPIFGSIRELLSKDQMKKIKAGAGSYKCCDPNPIVNVNCSDCSPINSCPPNKTIKAC